MPLYNALVDPLGARVDPRRRSFPGVDQGADLGGHDFRSLSQLSGIFLG